MDNNLIIITIITTIIIMKLFVGIVFLNVKKISFLKDAIIISFYQSSKHLKN